MVYSLLVSWDTAKEEHIEISSRDLWFEIEMWLILVTHTILISPNAEGKRTKIQRIRVNGFVTREFICSIMIGEYCRWQRWCFYNPIPWSSSSSRSLQFPVQANKSSINFDKQIKLRVAIWSLNFPRKYKFKSNQWSRSKLVSWSHLEHWFSKHRTLGTKGELGYKHTSFP